MAKRVKQFRYNGVNEKINNPPNINYSSLISGNIFNQYMPILQLSIEALPGTEFYINGNKNPIVIGASGLFEFGPVAGIEISSLAFSAKSVNAARSNGLAQIIVTLMYEN